MADNTVLPGTGDTIGTDDVAGVKYQIPKPTPKTIQAAGEPSPDVLMKQRNDRALRILLLAS